MYKDRVKSLSELIESITKIYDGNFNYSDEEIVILKEFEKFKNLIILKLSDIIEWNSDNVEKVINEVIVKEELTFKKIAQPLRLIITGCTFGPSIFKIIEILGNKETLKRIKKINI